LEQLLTIAQTGNMRAVRKQVAEISRQDERHRPFADRLLKLADEFRSIEIVELVEEAIAKTKAPPEEGCADVEREDQR
jgi:hypothetical protein